MQDKKPLSQYGVGPFYAAAVFILTIAALVLNHFKLLPVLSFAAAEPVLRLLGGACVIFAALLWWNAVIGMKIAQNIRNNRLVTAGAYAWVRNPIYSAIMIAMWGLLLWSGNLYLLVLCPVYHLLMTVMVKCTEEKWLTRRYGRQYLEYCQKVNRCIPWPPKQ